MTELQEFYDKRGVNLMRIENAWAFRTAGDLGFLMQREEVQQRKLSRAALEVLAIIAYHQPITRAEMEDIRGVETSKGTIDVLMETGLGEDARPAQDTGPPCHLRHDAGIPRSFRPVGNPRPAGDGGIEGRRAVVDAHAVELLHAAAEHRSGRTDRGGGRVTDIDLEELGLLTPKGGDD
jgi:segregation and condensation protein B